MSPALSSHYSQTLLLLGYKGYSVYNKHAHAHTPRQRKKERERNRERERERGGGEGEKHTCIHINKLRNKQTNMYGPNVVALLLHTRILVSEGAWLSDALVRARALTGKFHPPVVNQTRQSDITLYIGSRSAGFLRKVVLW